MNPYGRRPVPPDDGEPKPTIPHRFLTHASGEPIKFWEVLNEPCPACGRGTQPAKLAVLIRDEGKGSETVGCLSCDFQTTRRSQRKLGPMNSGR